jgi:hypothetical protein
MAYLALVFGGLEDTDELQTLLAVLRLVMAASTVALGLVRLLLTRKLILVGRVPIAILFQCVRFTDGLGEPGPRWPLRRCWGFVLFTTVATVGSHA